MVYRIYVFVYTREAKVEFGEAVARKLKLTKDGTTVLWPQPADDPEDPQNVRLAVCDDAITIVNMWSSQWSDFRKGLQLLIITLAAIVPDFDSGTGASGFYIAG